MFNGCVIISCQLTMVGYLYIMHDCVYSIIINLLTLNVENKTSDWVYLINHEESQMVGEESLSKR